MQNKIQCSVEFEFQVHKLFSISICQMLHEIYIYQKIIHCLSEIKIQLGILYFNLLHLATLKSELLDLSPCCANEVSHLTVQMAITILPCGMGVIMRKNEKCFRTYEVLHKHKILIPDMGDLIHLPPKCQLISPVTHLSFGASGNGC